MGFLKVLGGQKKTTRGLSPGPVPDSGRWLISTDGQPAKRRGPKPDSKPALTRRQELNRQAQRYFTLKGLLLFLICLQLTAELTANGRNSTSGLWSRRFRDCGKPTATMSHWPTPGFRS